MSIVGFVILALLNALGGLLRSKFNVGGFDVSDLQLAIENASGVYNIFAWVNEFIPVDFLLTLATLTTIFYGYKLILGLIRFILSIFKK